MRNLSIKLYHIYVCYTNITPYHIILSVRYFSRFHVTAVGLGTYYPWIRGSACIWTVRAYKIDTDMCPIFFVRMRECVRRDAT